MERHNLITANSCPNCKAQCIKKFYKLENWSIYKCKDCGYIFTNPYPAPETIHKYYDLDYYHDERHNKNYFEEDGSIKIRKIDYNSRVVDIENKFDVRGSILEIGSAHGEFLNVMKNRAWDVSGIEISKDACEIAKTEYGIELYNGTFLDFNSDKTFDVICLYQTLEHVYKPIEHIKKAYNMLRTGGIILIEVPNVYSFDMLISKKRRWYSFDLPRHLSHFYPSFLKKALQETGFEILYIDRYYPQFIINLLSSKKSDSVGVNPAQTDYAQQQNSLPLMRKEISWKGKIVKSFSYLFPGWKFTVVGKKGI